MVNNKLFFKRISNIHTHLNEDWKILQQRTYPPSVSIQLVDAWAPKTLPSVSYAVAIRDQDFLLQTLMTRMVGPL